jgi:hypothetical protein
LEKETMLTVPKKLNFQTLGVDRYHTVNCSK